MKAIATDHVPDGALKKNEDGTVNVYDENGNKVGTATAEEVAAAEAQITEIEIENQGVRFIKAKREPGLPTLFLNIVLNGSFE